MCLMLDIQIWEKEESFNVLCYMLHTYVFLCACLHVCAYTDSSS